MLLLLPPSEGKSAPTRGKPLDLGSLSFPVLTPGREEALDALVALCSADPAAAAEVLGLGPTQTGLATRNADLRTAPTARAEQIYTGVVYDALDAATLDAPARRRLRRVAVTSSVFGLVRLADRIPSYRLSGDTTLPGLGSVAAHWRRHLGEAVAEGVGSGVLVDLRSGTYAAFWRPEGDVARRTVTVRVLHEHQGTRKVVSHFNKATKGRIVRAVLTDGGTPRTPAAFATQLRDLGWYVEEGAPTARGTQLDVVVAEL
ncbi:peroxide stress protein YaaA [Nocardioides zeae]|uniref:Peroxide stress protein YaaA n=1 Tax=Nocardioides zeae TaxID=1457234 RepID=A0A6P0HE33_9ACTN|nr:peroxide stress protein YaaA [Nocardioides zeae]